MFPGETDSRLRLPEAVGQQFGEKAREAGEISRIIRENFIAWRRGGDTAVVHFPFGWEELASGEKIPKLPFYVITPTHTGEAPGGIAGNTWRVPRATSWVTSLGSHLFEGETRAIQIYGAEQTKPIGKEGLERPVAMLIADPVIPGNNVLCEMSLARGVWKPPLFGKMPIFMQEATRAVSLADGRSIGTFLQGLEDGGTVEEFDVTNLTAGPLVNAMVRWLNETYEGEYGPAFVGRNGLMEGLAIIGRLNPAWAAYWENVAARERLGAVLNNPAGNGHLIFGTIFKLSMMTYPRYLGELQATMDRFLVGLKEKRAHDWPSLIKFAREVFGGLDIPMVLNPAVNPLQSLLAAAYSRSLTTTGPVEHIIEKQQPEVKGQDLVMPWVTNPYELLLLFPPQLAVLGEAMMTTFPDKLAAIARQKVAFVQAGMEAERMIDEAFMEAMNEFTNTLRRKLDGIGGIRAQARRKGREVAGEIAEGLPSDIAGVLDELYGMMERMRSVTEGKMDPRVLGLPQGVRPIGKPDLRSSGLNKRTTGRSRSGLPKLGDNRLSRKVSPQPRRMAGPVKPITPFVSGGKSTKEESSGEPDNGFLPPDDDDDIPPYHPTSTSM